MNQTPAQIYGHLLAGDKIKLIFPDNVALAKFKNQMSVAKHRETTALLKASAITAEEAKQKLVYSIKQVGSSIHVVLFLEEKEPLYQVELVTDEPE